MLNSGVSSMLLEDFFIKKDVNINYINYLVVSVKSGNLSVAGLHSKKAYAKKKGHLNKVFCCAIAFEILKMQEVFHE